MLSFKLNLKKVTTPITLFITLSVFSLGSVASETTTSVENLNQLIQEKLDFYNKTFPQIQFVHLKNGEWEKSLQALELFIGYQATNLDYEHPVDLREELLYATVEKIRLMLIHKVTSSYLFKVGEIPAASKKFVCVVTLDPETSVLNNRVATEYLVDLPREILDKVLPNKHVNNEHHLEFIIDHEAFHCLDTFHHGGIPMSKKQYSTHYDTFKRENQADMFALAMHLHRHKKLSSCATNMMMLRGMTLLNGEPQHNTVEAMQLVIEADQETLKNSPPDKLFALTKDLYKTLSPSYEEYIQYRVAAVTAIKKLGKQVNEPDKPLSPAGMIPDENLVSKLLDQTYKYYQQFTGQDLKP